MNHRIRPTLLVPLATAFCVLMSTRPAEAGLSLSIKLVNTTYDVSSYLHLNNGSSTTYSFGSGSVGNNSYLAWDTNNSLTGPTVSTTAPPASYLGIRITITDNAPGGVSAQLFDVSNEVRGNDGGNAVAVSVTALETGYKSPTGNVTLTSTFSANPNATYTSSVLQGSSTLASVTGTGTSNSFNVTGTYSLRSVTSLMSVGQGMTYTTNGQTTVNGKGVVLNPEPSTIVSASIAGVMGLGYAWRRRRRTAT